MRIAILSDIHDHIWNLAQVMDGIKGEADAVICCGDLCSPFVVKLFGEGFINLPVHIVFGNNDGDLFRITNAANKNIFLHGELAELVEVDGHLISRQVFEQEGGKYFDSQEGGKRIAVTHFNNIALAVAATGAYDVVCYGHNHQFSISTVDTTLAINPGTVMGYDPGMLQNIPATFAMYNTETDDVQGYEVMPPGESESGVRQIAPYPSQT